MSDPQTINCEEALRRLFAYIDGELGGGHAVEMDLHLHQCRSCFSRVEFERRLKSHLAELGHHSVDAGFQGRIRALIQGFTCS